MHVIAGVYRLWKCTGGELDDLGIASIQEDYNGGREFWFERVPLTNQVCVFQAEGDGGTKMNLTSGAIPFDPHVRTYGIIYISLGAVPLPVSMM